MKQFYLFLFCLFVFTGFSQSPQLINYQGIIRDVSGTPVANRPVNVQFVIYGGSVSNVVFTESVSVTTNSLGLFSTQIGKTQSLSGINWQANTHSLQVNADASGGSNFVAMGGPQQIVSVPYAMHANSVPATYSNNVLTIGTNNSFTLATPAVTNPTITGTGLANVSPTTGLSFTVDVPSASISLISNSIILSQGTVVSTATLPTISNTITGTGIAAVTPTTGNVFAVNVPTAGLSSNVNTITLTQGTVVSTATVPSVSHTITATGIAAVTPTTGSVFAVSVPSAGISSNSNTLTLTQGTVVSTATLPVTPNTSLVSTGLAITSTLATNSYSINVPVPALTSNSNTLTLTQGTVVSTATVPVTPNTSLISTGLAVTSTLATNSFSINVPVPALTSNINTLTLTQGTVVSTATVPVTPNTSVVSTGLAVTSTLATNSFSINVPAPALTSNSNTLTLTQGTVVTTATVPPVSSTITGAGIASVSPSSGNVFTVTVNQPTFAYSQVTGSLTSGTTSAYITPSLSITGGTLISGPPSNSIAINSGTNALWSTLGNTATNPTVNFLGTIDNIALNFRVNNQKSGTIDPALQNTFFGYQSGLANTTGSLNTAIGAQALDANTTGVQNVALGFQALSFNTIGSQNTGVGYLALSANTTGSNNAAFGSQALQNNLTGINSSAFGDQALSNNTTGTHNDAFGRNALTANTTGSYNIAIGNWVLSSNTSGNRNVAIGAGAGTALTTGTGNVFIGNQAGAFETGSDKLYISNSTTSVSPLIFGDFASGHVGIGTTNANGLLQFDNSVVNRKIVLWEGANNDHQYYGFGVNGGTLRYQVNSTGDDHVFYAGTGAATSNEVFRIKGNGLFKMGNETGTGQPPIYPNGGMMIRSLFTSNSSAGQVVARTDIVSLERDGTNGGFRVNRTGGNGDEVCNCFGINFTGASVNRALNNLGAGVTSLYTNADNMVFIHCIFGDPYAASHMAEITITREFADYFWLGTVITTYNQ